MEAKLARKSEEEMAMRVDGKEIHARYMQKVEEAMIKHADEKKIVLRIESKDAFVMMGLSQHWEKTGIKWLPLYIWADASKPIDIQLTW